MIPGKSELTSSGQRSPFRVGDHRCKQLPEGAGKLWTWGRFPQMIARTIFCAAVFLSVLVADPAAAHRMSPVGSTAGLSIPGVSHGQMVVLAANRDAIVDLANVQYPTDSDMRRLQSFVNLQYFYCAWGLFPGSLTDEDSPFNECAHAYLGGIRSLLIHLEGMSGNRAPALALRRKIDSEMLDQHSSMILCRFSDEPFNTADVIIPSTSAVVSNPVTLATILLIGLVSFGCGCMTSIIIRHVRRRRSPEKAHVMMRPSLL